MIVPDVVETTRGIGGTDEIVSTTRGDEGRSSRAVYIDPSTRLFESRTRRTLDVVCGASIRRLVYSTGLLEPWSAMPDLQW